MSDTSDRQTSPAERKPTRRHIHPRIPGLSDLLGPYAPFAIAAAFAALAVLAAIADRSLLGLDRPISRDVRSIHAMWFNTLMHGWSYLGNRFVLAPLTVVLAIVAWRHCRWFAIAFFLALPGAFIVEVVFKAIVTRPRPVAQGFGSSFPSGDAIGATVFWGLLPPVIYLVTGKRRLWLASIPLVILVLVGVGLERIYFGAHWPSDVVGGYLGGAMFIFAAEGVLRHGSLRRRRGRWWPLGESRG